MPLSLNVPSNPHTTYNVSLEGVKYFFTYRWNVRQEIWYLDVFTSNRIPIVIGAALLEATDLLRRVTSYSPKGLLTIIKNSETTAKPNRFNIGVGKDYELIYFTESEVNANRS